MGLNKRALITGAAGFIGSHLCDRMLNEGWNITAVDNFDSFYSREAKMANIQDHLDNPAYTLAEVDIRDAGSLAAVVRGSFDVIVHLAGKAGVRPSLVDPAGYQAVN